MSEALQTPAAGVPRRVLFGAGALVAFALVAVLFGRASGVGDVHMTETHPYQVLQLRFFDRDDGGVAIVDATTGVLLDKIAPGTNGFVRGALRGFAQERRRDGIGPATPFVLTRWDDGTLSLQDKAIGRRIDLDAVGHTQAEVFARLFLVKEAAK
jgi:putative photosynthetic complex assembly protein